MRSITLLRLLLVPAALFGAACDETSLPEEPTADEAPADLPSPAGTAALTTVPHWADGYLHAGSPTDASYSPLPYLSFNRAGGAINIRKPSGTTGRYVVTFRGLSALIGSKHTVHVTEYGLNDTYCKPMAHRLVADTLEVRCFRASTRAAANAAFTVAVLRTGIAFTYANTPSATMYSPPAGATLNPGGATWIYRTATGRYRVTFSALAKIVRNEPNGGSGHVQVNAIGTGKAHCVVNDWGSPDGVDLNVLVDCRTPAGTLVDSRFNVFFALQIGHMTYTFANQPEVASYTAPTAYTWNQTGRGATIQRTGVGDYTVRWPGIDPEIVDGGTVLVSSASLDGTQCKATALFDEGIQVHCFGPSGAPREGHFTALLAS
jgi:hypothetical protein